MSESMIGRTFSGRYRIVERIGVGGMAEVYRAQDTVLGRIVAVKVMLPQYAADSDFTQRFRQEAASAANLQSPYIVNVYDWGQDEGTYYIVMEYVRGGDLKTAIKERHSINQRKVAEIASQTCQALSVAHGQDIVHRDIKPQNIMVQPDGNVKVMDFGIARAKNSVKARTSSVLGTAHYISPEQAQGKELTAASDIYSLGVCMYEAITGQLPFDGPDAVSVAMKQVNEQPKPLHEIFPGVDPVLEAIVLRAMQKDPVKRFPTALDMRRVLNDYLAGRARGTAAAAAILAGTGVAAATAGAASTANAATQRMGTGVDQQTTQMINNGAMPGGQTQVMPVANNQGGQAQWSGNGVASNNPRKYEAPVAPEEKKHTGRTVLIVLLVLAILAGGAYALFSLGFFNSSTVPDVAGKTVEQATSALEDAGYTVSGTEEVYSDTVEKNKVVSTDPAAGEKADKGTSIKLKVSKGKEQVEIPDVIGKDETTAKKLLTDAGFTPVAGDTVYSDTVEKDMVASVNPIVGMKADKGSKVTYQLSKGADTVDLPSVVGQTKDKATTALKNAGFTVNVTEDYSDEVEKGYVISQDPSDSKVKKGATVTICVSLGQKTVKVPDVVGETLADAIAELENAGFTVTTTSSYSGSAIVTNQSATGEAKEGATINLTAKESSPSSSSSSGTKSSSRAGFNNG